MPNIEDSGASLAERAIRASLHLSLSERLTVCMKSITAVESGRTTMTHNLYEALTLVLKSVDAENGIAYEDLERCLDLRARARAFSPRSVKNKNKKLPQPEDAWSDEESSDLARSPDTSHRSYPSKESSVVVPDGYEKDFLNFDEVIARVTQRYGSAPPKADSIELLNTALGTIPLDGHSARQLWLCLAYHYKEVGGSFDTDHYASKLLPLQAIWIQTALCYYGNRNDLGLGSKPSVPNCFTHVLDPVGFGC